MALSVLYTEEAKATLVATCNFIAANFGQKSSEKFLLKAEKTIKLLTQQPYMFKSSDIDEQVRIGLITKQCSLFYRVTDEAIHLLFFWDNRQEPLNL